MTSLGDQCHQPPTHLSQHLGHLFHLPTPIEFNSNPWGFSFQSWSQIPSPVCVCLCPQQLSPAAPLRTFWSTSVCPYLFPAYNHPWTPLPTGHVPAASCGLWSPEGCAWLGPNSSAFSLCVCGTHQGPCSLWVGCSHLHFALHPLPSAFRDGGSSLGLFNQPISVLPTDLPFSFLHIYIYIYIYIYM